jgi:hypothetical protein
MFVYNTERVNRTQGMLWGKSYIYIYMLQHHVNNRPQLYSGNRENAFAEYQDCTHVLTFCEFIFPVAAIKLRPVIHVMLQHTVACRAVTMQRPEIGIYTRDVFCNGRETIEQRPLLGSRNLIMQRLDNS